MNLRNLMISGASRAYYAAEADAGGGGADAAAADVADPSLIGDAGDAADKAADDAADKSGDDGKGADGADKGDKSGADGAEHTAEQKAEAEAALAVPFEGLKAPEGFDALDADLLTAATPIMRGQLGIDTPEKAQAFVDAHKKRGAA